MGKFVLRVILYKCSDLVAADDAIAGGKSDPYVEFSVANSAVKKSSIIMNSLDPVWSPPEKIEIEMDMWEHQFLLVHVFDYDRFSRDDLIGSAVIPLTLFAGGRHNEMYNYPLVLPDDEIGGPRSFISLQISLTTKDGQSVEYYYY